MQRRSSSVGRRARCTHSTRNGGALACRQHTRDVHWHPLQPPPSPPRLHAYSWSPRLQESWMRQELFPPKPRNVDVPSALPAGGHGRAAARACSRAGWQPCGDSPPVFFGCRTFLPSDSPRGSARPLRTPRRGGGGGTATEGRLFRLQGQALRSAEGEPADQQPESICNR